MAKWYDKGESAFERDEEREERAKKSRNRKGASAYSLRPGKQGEFFVIDDATIFRMIHTGKGPKKNQFWQATCAGDEGDCRGCNEDIGQSNVYTAGTIINITGFVDDEGKRVRFYKQVLDLKGDAKAEFWHQRELLKKKYGKDQTLAGTWWRARRSKEGKSLRTGNHFELVRRLSKKQFMQWLKKKGVTRDDWKEFLAPFDYLEIFAPPSEKEWDKLLGPAGVRPGSEDDDTWDDDLTDDPDDDDAGFDDDDTEEKPKKGKKKTGKKKPRKDDDDFVDLDDDAAIEDLV